MNLNELIEYTAAYFKNLINENEFDTFDEMKYCYDWSSTDIKDEMLAVAREVFDGVFDDGDIEIDGELVSYRSFNRRVLNAIKKE